MSKLAKLEPRRSVVGPRGLNLSSNREVAQPLFLSVDSDSYSKQISSLISPHSLEPSGVVFASFLISLLQKAARGTEVIVAIIESVVVSMIPLHTIAPKKTKNLSMHGHDTAASIITAIRPICVKLTIGSFVGIPIEFGKILKTMCADLRDFAARQRDNAVGLVKRLNNGFPFLRGSGHDSTSNGTAAFGRIAIIASLLFPLSAMAQNSAVNGFCTRGGTPAMVSGLPSTNTPQQIIPSCTVTVFLTGTSTKATIFSSISGAPLANPFIANATGSAAPGQWLFYAANGAGLDVTMSGGIAPNTFPLPVTITDIIPGGGGGGGGGGNPALPFFSVQFNNASVFGGSGNLVTDAVGNLRSKSYDGLNNALGNQSSPGSNNGIANALSTPQSFVVAGPDYAGVEASYAGSGTVCAGTNYRLAIGCPPPFANGTELFDYRYTTQGSYTYNPSVEKYDRLVSNQLTQGTLGVGGNYVPYGGDFELTGSGINGFTTQGGPDSWVYDFYSMEALRQGIGSYHNLELQSYSLGDMHLYQTLVTNNRGITDGSGEGFQVFRNQISQNISPMTTTANSTLAAGATQIAGTLVSSVPFVGDATYYIDVTKAIGPIRHITANLNPGGSGPQSAGQWTVDGPALTPDNIGRVAAAVNTPKQYKGVTTNETINVTGLTLGPITTATTVCVADATYQESAKVVSAGSFSGGNQTITVALQYPHGINFYVAQGAGTCTFVEARANQLPNGTADPGRDLIRKIANNGTQTMLYAQTGAGNWLTVPSGFFSTSVIAPAGTTLTRASNVVSVLVTDPFRNLSNDAFFVTGCTDSSFNGGFQMVSDSGTAVTWNQTGANATTTCTSAIEIASRQSSTGVREIQEFPGSEITNPVDPVTNAMNYNIAVQPNTNLQVTSGDTLENHPYPQVSTAITNDLISYQTQTSPSLGQVIYNVNLSGEVPEGITITQVAVNDFPVHYLGMGGTKQILNTLYDASRSLAPFNNLFALPAPVGTAFSLQGCPYGCTDSRSKFVLLDVSTAFPDYTWTFHQDTNLLETQQLSATNRLTIDYSPAGLSLVNVGTGGGVIAFITPSLVQTDVQSGGGVSLTISQSSTAFTLTETGGGTPVFQIIGIGDGCATFASGVLGSTGVACGAGGGSPLTTKGDLFGFSTVNARIPVGTNGQVLTADSTAATGVSWQAVSGTGTVMSVAETVPTSILAISGSPITTSGTFALTLATQSANLVWAGPTSGSAATPTFRSLVINDLPGSIPNSKLANVATTVNGQTCTLGSTCTVGITWDAIGAPAGNLSLSFGSRTTLFTYGATTGSSDMFALTDSASNTGIGILFHTFTASGSTEIPWQADANGVGFKIDATGALVGVGSSASHGMVIPEGTPISGVGSSDVLTTSSTTHRLTMNNNNGGAQSVAGLIASGTTAMPTTSLAGNSCDASATTATATGATTSDAPTVAYASDPTGVTGYGGGTSGGITIRSWTTSNTINFKRCNESGGSITSGALSVNWVIAR